mgnify:CR=1 FL=1
MLVATLVCNEMTYRSNKGSDDVLMGYRAEPHIAVSPLLHQGQEPPDSLLLGLYFVGE